jgi:hypothetical protein
MAIVASHFRSYTNRMHRVNLSGNIAGFEMQSWGTKNEIRAFGITGLKKTLIPTHLICKP